VYSGGEEIMAKRKKRAKAKRRAKLRRTTSTARNRARKASKSARRGKTKRTKRAAKKVLRRKQQRAKSPSRDVETVVIDVIEEPVPGVITVTEFEETQIPGRGWAQTKGDDET
jgi:hypothetical protein